MKKIIDTEKFSSALRSKGIDLSSQKILITKFYGSEQEKDITLGPNCAGFGRIHHFRRNYFKDWIPNPLPIDPAIFKLNLPLTDKIEVQLFQNSICSWRCWYCFVDDKLLSANKKFAEFKSAEEILELYLREKFKAPIIDLSGGQPDLVPEWTLWFYKELNKKGLNEKVYLWSDDNLSNDYLWRYLSKEQIKELSKAKNYGRVGCLKGFDEYSFSFNTHADRKLFSEQFKLLRKLIEAGFDIYGYVTLTTDLDKNIPIKVSDFIDKIQESVHPIFPLRTIPLKVIEFTPTKNRMNENYKSALEIQKEVLSIWMEEINKRFDKITLKKFIYEHELSL